MSLSLPFELEDSTGTGFTVAASQSQASTSWPSERTSPIDTFQHHTNSNDWMEKASHFKEQTVGAVNRTGARDIKNYIQERKKGPAKRAGHCTREVAQATSLQSDRMDGYKVK